VKFPFVIRRRVDSSVEAELDYEKKRRRQVEHKCWELGKQWATREEVDVLLGQLAEAQKQAHYWRTQFEGELVARQRIDSRATGSIPLKGTVR
jgi:hypothetical protein